MKKITVLLSVLVLALGILAAGCGGGDKKEEKKPAASPAVKEELIVISLAEDEFDLGGTEFLIAHQIPAVIVEFNSVDQELCRFLVRGIHLEYRIADVLLWQHSAHLLCFKKRNDLVDDLLFQDSKIVFFRNAVEHFNVVFYDDVQFFGLLSFGIGVRN